MNEEKNKEIPMQPLEDEEISSSVGGRDPFANLPLVKNAPIDERVTENG